MTPDRQTMDTSSCESCSVEATEAELLEQLDELLEEYVDQPGSLIPVLQMTQAMFGYLPEVALKKISHRLGKSYSEVAGVVSFYSFFSTVPRGKYLVRVCLGTACYVRGAKQVLDSLKQYMGVEVGETTSDRLFSLDIGRCFGACGLAPVVMVNDDTHRRVRPTKVGEIIAQYRAAEEQLEQSKQPQQAIPAGENLNEGGCQ
jgi:NADH-quinone oxidoreductase subunit E